MATEQHVVIYLFLFYFSTLDTVNTKISGNLSNIISETKDGPCVKGQMYKVDCNTCHCTGSALVCTKMACLRTPGLKKGTLRRSGNICTPGVFYKNECRRCFCSNEMKLICGPKDCRTVGKLPKTHEAIHAHSSHGPAEQHVLPTLPHQSAQCNPGSSYRIDCNTCLCLANGNLVCGPFLCPSHDDVHKREAKKLSGKTCAGVGQIDQVIDCVQCWCVDGSNVCQAILGCVPTGNHVPLELKTSGHCIPGMIYKEDCNRCYCNEYQALQCTLKYCFNRSQFNRLHTTRTKWIDNTLRRSGNGTLN